MNGSRDPRNPLVSVILPTRDRPQFLGMALRCYQQQVYEPTELIVVDDSLEPLDAQAVEAVGGRVISMRSGTPLGTKLNRGVMEARGSLCQKMDDDDWYAEHFLTHMVDHYLQGRDRLCRPTVANLTPYLTFDLVRWRIVEPPSGRLNGGTLLFAREETLDSPFRAITNAEDTWFVSDLREFGQHIALVWAPESFLQVRHRHHTWVKVDDTLLVDEYFARMPEHERTPEELLPGWAVDFYRDLHRTFTESSSGV